MTAAVLDRPMSRPTHLPDGDRMTLDELLNSALHEARTYGSTECPVCHSGMTARTSSTRARMSAGSGEGAGSGEAVAAECGGCGSRLG